MFSVGVSYIENFVVWFSLYIWIGMVSFVDLYFLFGNLYGYWVVNRGN